MGVKKTQRLFDSWDPDHDCDHNCQVAFILFIDRYHNDHSICVVKHMALKYKLTILLLISLFITLFITSHTYPQDQQDSPPREKTTLVEAVMCESIKDFTPQNQAILFSIGIGRISCFTSFDPVLEETHIYHTWFRRDKLSTRLKLSLHPPRWSTFSSIQLREADQGPWRVEITDKNGRILRLLRFSITD